MDDQNMEHPAEETVPGAMPEQTEMPAEEVPATDASAVEEEEEKEEEAAA